MLLTMQLIERAGLSGGRPLFFAVTLQQGREVYGEQPTSYSCLRGMMLAAIADIGLPVEAFGTHTMRAGGATMADNQGVPDRVCVASLMSRSQKRENEENLIEPESDAPEIGAGPPPYLTPSA